MKYTLIVSAGAGDTIRDFYWNQQYVSIEDMGPEDTCDIHITGINPFLHEFFPWHPLASQLTVKSYGYFVPDQEEDLKKLHGIPLDGDYNPLPRSTKPVVFYPSPEDRKLLDSVKDYYSVVFSPVAGTPDRDLPSVIVDLINRGIYEDNECGYVGFQVGRTFDRQGRHEEDYLLPFNLVDRLSLPGVCQLVKEADGVVCSHSMVSMLAWCIRKPQLLLYSDTVRDRHFLSPDMWSWGAGFPECVHATFDAFNADPQIYINRFLQAMKVGDK